MCSLWWPHAMTGTGLLMIRCFPSPVPRSHWRGWLIPSCVLGGRSGSKTAFFLYCIVRIFPHRFAFFVEASYCRLPPRLTPEPYAYPRFLSMGATGHYATKGIIWHCPLLFGGTSHFPVLPKRYWGLGWADSFCPSLAWGICGAAMG